MAGEGKLALTLSLSGSGSATSLLGTGVKEELADRLAVFDRDLNSVGVLVVGFGGKEAGDELEGVF